MNCILCKKAKAILGKVNQRVRPVSESVAKILKLKKK